MEHRRAPLEPHGSRPTPTPRPAAAAVARAEEALRRAPGPPPPVAARTIRLLQGQVGNRAVQRMLATAPAMAPAPALAPVQRQIGNGADQRPVLRERDRVLFVATLLPDWSEDGTHRYRLNALHGEEVVTIVSGDQAGYRLAQERVAFGHGVNLGKDYRQQAGTAECVVVFYGPLEATLSRAVAKWVRVRGIVPAGSLRVVPNDVYDKLLARYGGSCASFEQDLWSQATPTDYPQVIPPGHALPHLSLERQTEEDISGEPQVPAREIAQVALPTPIREMQKGMGPTDVLHWGACQNPDGKLIRGTDLSVILDPALSAQVYPPDAAEIRREKEYQERKAARQQPRAPAPTFQSQSRVTDLSDTLVQALRADYKATDKLDDQVARLKVLATQHDVPWAKLMRFLGQEGLKGSE